MTKRHHPHHLLLLAAALAAAPAAAQIGNPGFTMPNTPMAEPGVPAPNHTNTVDRLFMRLVAQGGMAEVETGKLADARGGDERVKAFGRRMVQDHAKANAQLAALARAAAVPLPQEVAPEHRGLREQLQSLQGADFDRAYLQGQIVEHQKTVQLLVWEIGQGQEAQLQRFAAATLPTVLEHLDHLQRLWSQATGAPPQGMAATAAMAAPAAAHDAAPRRR